MAGGTWIDQNKVRPGVYINYKSSPSSLATMGERGTVAIAHLMDWGAVTSGKFYTIRAPEDVEQLNHALTDPEMLFIRQILLGTNRSQGASKILVWALAATGTAAIKASVTVTVDSDSFTATAKYAGTYGNKLSVAVTASGANFIFDTLLNGKIVDSQTIAAAANFTANDYIDSVSGTLVATAGAPLTGGTDGTTGSSDYEAFLNALQTLQFDIVIYDGTDATVKQLYANFVKSQSNNEGVKCQAVISDYASADNECVISVYAQSVTLADGTVLTAPQLTWWVGGASAGANVFESLTYSTYPDAIDVTPKLTSAQQESAINAGQFCLIPQFERIQVLTDINTFTTFNVEKGKAFRKNRVIRTVFGLCNDIYKAFSLYYIGAVHNDEEGRKSLKAEILNLMYKYQGNRALQNVIADDVTVIAGVDSDAVVIEIYCQPVDSIEKIYINITIS